MAYRHEHETHHHHHHEPPRPTSYHEETKISEPVIPGDIVRVFTKADTKFSLTARGENVVLAPENDSDYYQQWIKDDRWSTKVKDSKGFPAFVLVNRGTGKALKHQAHAENETPVHLGEYHGTLDESVLWTQGKDEGHGFHAIRPANNIGLNLDASHGVKTKKDAGVHDGTPVILFEWKEGDNQIWQIVTIGKNH